MRAWSVSEKRNYEVSKLVFAETVSKAKSLAFHSEEFDGVEWTELTVRRAKYADDKENLSERDLMILNIREGAWWYEINGYYIDSDNIEEAIKEGRL